MLHRIGRRGIVASGAASLAFLLSQQNCMGWAQSSKASKAKSQTEQAKPAELGPNLVDTLSFVKQTLDAYGKTTLTEVGSSYRWTQTDTSSIEETRDCNLVLHTTTTFWGSPAVVVRDHPNESATWRLNLSAMDPKSIALEELSSNPFAKGLEAVGATLHIVATNNAKAVKSADEHGADGSSVYIRIASMDIGNRLATAVLRAITLCGGKPSAL